MTNRPALAVIGLGYVGLPLAMEAVRAGMRVHGLDQDASLIAGLLEGRSHVDDVTDEQVADAVAHGFVPTTDPVCLGSVDVVVICVPTPLCEGTPDLDAVKSATEQIARAIRPGTLVVLESTSYPGTTHEMLLPALEKSGRRVGRDFHLAYSPERIDPGNSRFGLRNTPKVVGGVTTVCTDAAVGFYRQLADEVVRVGSPAVAEMSKLLENTYRQVNIALVNEMAVFCHDLGIDLWEAIDAASTKPFGFQAFRPGPGVGGHCIPIDPNYLSHRVRSLGYPFRFVELAQEINGRMPVYVADRVMHLLNDDGLALRGSRVLLLGVTYKADVADQRESPSLVVAERLLALGARVSYHDPFIPEWDVAGERLFCVPDLDTALSEATVTVILQTHRHYDLDVVAKHARRVLDTRGRADGANVTKL